MFKIIVTFFLFLILFKPEAVFAQTNSFVSVVNPVRGEDFWEQNGQKIDTAVIGQTEILSKFNVPATWLLRFDALDNREVLDVLNTRLQDEKGLFLEVTPSWANESGTSYNQSDNWHDAGSAFLSGYEPKEREKLIDSSFRKFKEIFGYFPKSVGAWWVDAYSLDYMQKKYGILASLIVADQYTTDNYQIWGQYFSTPYYPSKRHALHPAQNQENKLPVVMMQWAARDPVNGYGKGVEESTFSVQANDYIDYHNLNTKYFSKIVSLHTKQNFNSFGHIVSGLENSYSWEKYKAEYENQIKALTDKQTASQLKIVTMQDFASWYSQTFPDLSPQHLIVADDPLGSSKKTVWFMNPYYRAGWFYSKDGSVFRDIRQYRDGEEEPCLLKACHEINFATSATRVLDEVSFGHKLILDEGGIYDFSVKKIGENLVISYKNETGRQREVEFLPRDIRIDDKISSIDGIILEATKEQLDAKKDQTFLKQGPFKWSILGVLTKTLLFLGFLILACFVSGWILVDRIVPKKVSVLKKIITGIILGLSSVTLLFYIFSILNLKQAIFIYVAINLVILIKISRSKNFVNIVNLNFFRDKFNLVVLGLIFVGSLFQSIPTFKNGLNFPYGLGFWGPNTHDGIWHISLINQLTKSVPPQNPIFGGEVLKNYHYFYDLLVATTSYITGIPVLDLVFRFYPITFSILLGFGTFCLIKYFFKIQEKIAIFFAIYLVYFAGSFGWIVEYLREKHLGGESAFWANQSISFNLNPPFAISLLIIIAILLLLPNLKTKLSIAAVSILAGSLVAFKAYGAILILLSFLLAGILKRNLHYIIVGLLSSLFSAFLVLQNFSLDKKLIIFSPFWFIHSMIDSPDRVGWVRLSLARVAGAEQGNWFKFLAAEAVSFLIFLIGNLGTRTFALLSLIKIRYIVRRADFLFIFIFSSLAFAIPVLFIQVGNPWNTIQFVYYFLYITAILGGIIFAKFVLASPKPIAVVSTLIFISITPINSWATANGYLSYNPHAFVSNPELEALRFLASKQDGTVLTYPYDKSLRQKLAEPWPLFAYDSTSYVSAFSKKGTFFEDEPQNQILLADYKKRKIASTDFFIDGNSDFLKSNNIKYIYLTKINRITLDQKKLPIKQIFENSEIIIYEVIN